MDIVRRTFRMAIPRRRYVSHGRSVWAETNCAGAGSSSANIRSLRTFLALLDLVFNPLILGQAFMARALDLGEMREKVFVAIVLGNETEAFAVVKPFHNTRLSRH
jgi:hypothetical protein